MTRPIYDSTGQRVRAFSKGPPRARAARAHDEADFQKAVIEYLGYALPPGRYEIRGGMEGAKRSYYEQATAKGTGLSKGWLDLMLMDNRTREYRWIECKSLTGRVTPEQARMLAILKDHAAVCRTLEDVEAALIRWGVTPQCAIPQANRYALALR